MTYNITRTDGSTLIDLPENHIDNETISNLSLIGKMIPDYGTLQSNNFVHIVENFASDYFPENPIKGMIVYRTDLSSLYYCVNEQTDHWIKIMAIRFDNEGIPNEGDVKYDNQTKQLWVYDSIEGWILIGPHNYFNKEYQNSIVKAEGGSSTTQFIIEMESNKTTMVTAKIVGREFIDITTPHPNINKAPQAITMIVRFMTNSFISTTGIETSEIIGNPSFEIIGHTDGEAQNWTVDVSMTSDHNVQILLTGLGLNPMPVDINGSVNWAIDVEIMKVADNDSN